MDNLCALYTFSHVHIMNVYGWKGHHLSSFTETIDRFCSAI